MVEVKIVIEGGVLSHDNLDVLTISNNAVFRESFHKLLTQIVDPYTFNLEIEMGGGEKSAANIFKKAVEQKRCLLIDLDGKAETRANRLVYFELENYSDAVFFMVQKMEAWILSQPKAIIAAMQHHQSKKEENEILTDTIFSKEPESIVHPVKQLNTLLSRYYFMKKRGIEKKKKYGKLKDAPYFIQYLNAQLLKDTFIDVCNLFEYLQLSNQSEN